MDFRFLGPLEVWSEGRSLPLGGHKQRGLLTVLLLNANSVVSADRLIDDVWGEQAPRTVHAYIQNCISRLRGVLGRAAIETHPGGYLLRVDDDDDVDALRFARAVAAARSLEAPQRVAALGEALASWRGQPLAEFAFEPFAQPELARLEELRLEAVEARLEAELELGRHVAALPELEALSARHPGRERLRALQMLALYRAGRQHEALAAYQDARRELVEQFGLEPGDDLRALERMILAQDPSLREPPVRPAPVHGRCIVLVVDPPGKAAAEILARLGGTLGSADDRLAAVWGVPSSYDGDALRALEAARAVHDGVPGVRIAIERVRDVGELDAKLVTAAAPGDTLLGPVVLPLVAHAVDVVAHPPGGFRVLHVDPDAQPVQRRFGSPLVGRAEELARLEDELAAAGSGSARRLIVFGDAGIGKTRLAREFAARRSGPVLWAHCTQTAGRDPVGELLDQVGLPEAARGRSTWAEERWALRRHLELLATGAPLTIVVDDLQWASANVLDLIDYLVGWARAPILVLGLARPELLERRPDLEAQAWHLDPLGADEASRLAQALPEAERIDPGALAALVEAAEGNPLYVEQLAAWAGEAHVQRVPATIDLLISTRVERLPEDERRALERAAVVGVEFWRGGVEAASPDDERPAVTPALMALARRRLVHPAPTQVEGEDGFRFHHALIRDVVYGGIAEDARARLHAAVAQSLGPDPTYDAVAGDHLERAAAVYAEYGDEAARRLGAAGLHALRSMEPGRSIDLLSRAARFVAEGAQRRELDWGVATAVKFAGDPARADGLLDDVAKRAFAAGDEANELRARTEQVWPRLGSGALGVDAALGLLDRAVTRFEETHDDFGAARAWDISAAVNAVYLLRATDCERAEQRALAFYERAGSASGAAHVRIAGASWFGPAPVGEAIATCERLLAESDTPVWASFVQPFLGGLLAMQGRFDEARAALEAARLGRAEFADPRTLDTSWTVIAADVELRAGDLAGADRVLSGALDRLRATGDSEWIAWISATLGGIRLRQERPADALPLAEAALAAVPSAHLTVTTIARRVRAVALARLGRLDDALLEARRGIGALEQADALVELGRARVALAEVLDCSGDATGASELRAEAAALFERKGDVTELVLC